MDMYGGNTQPPLAVFSIFQPEAFGSLIKKVAKQLEARGYCITASRGTSEFLGKIGISAVSFEELLPDVASVTMAAAREERAERIADAIRQGKVGFVFIKPKPRTTDFVDAGGIAMLSAAVQNAECVPLFDGEGCHIFLEGIGKTPAAELVAKLRERASQFLESYARD